jgi:hypothetical protein
MATARRRYTRSSGAMLIVAVIACSGDEDDAAPRQGSATIDVKGGTVESSGISLRIPPSALAEPRTITITRVDEAAPAETRSLSPVYRFEPAGLVFKVPVAVEIAFTGDSNAALYWTAIGEDRFEDIGGVVDGAKLRANVGHFSRGFVGIKSVKPPVVLDGGAGETGACGVCRGVRPACCGGVCRDLASDPGHCGRCDSACPAGMTCASSACYGGGGGTCAAAGMSCSVDSACCTGRCTNGTCG